MCGHTSEWERVYSCLNLRDVLASNIRGCGGWTTDPRACAEWDTRFAARWRERFSCYSQQAFYNVRTGTYNSTVRRRTASDGE